MRLGFLVLIGLPGSGKTTLAKALKNNYKEHVKEEYHFIHICYDKLIPFTKLIEKNEWKILRNSVASDIDKLIRAIKSKNKELSPPVFQDNIGDLISFEKNIILLVDDNMYFKSMRYTLYQLAKEHSTGFCQVYINCPVYLALANNSERNCDSLVPPDIIKNMAMKIEPPDINSNWEKYSLTIDACCDIKNFCTKLFPVLIASLINCQHPIHDSGQKNISYLECKRNILHQTDLTLRKIIGLKVKELTSSNMDYDLKTIISELNKRKSEIFYDIKVGNICLPCELKIEIEEGIENQNKLIKYLSDYF